jgi:hypothetical protein
VPKIALTDSGDINLVGDDGTWVTAAMPPGVTMRSPLVYPAMAQFKGHIYIMGTYSHNLVVTRWGQVILNGIEPPSTAPTLTAGAGTSAGAGPTGFQLGYVSFLIKDADDIICESNLSPGSPVIDITDQAIEWSSLPTTTYTLANYMRGYRSVDGGVPLVAWELPIATTTVTDTMGIVELALQEAAVVATGVDGVVTQDNNARGVLPYCTMVEPYGDTMVYSGDPDHPERVYVSRFQEPQAVNILDFRQTKDGSQVTGLKRWSDVVVVSSARSMHALQGFDSGDYQMVRISSFYGTIAPKSMAIVGPNGDLWFASQDGVVRYNGAFTELMTDTLRTYWRTDYQANQVDYEHAFACEDRWISAGYVLVVPQLSDATLKTFKFFGHTEPVKRGQMPWWVFDRQARKIGSLGILTSGGRAGQLYSGSCDGYIRLENVASNSDDDEDTYAKAMTITHKHYFFGDQSGDEAHGNAYRDIDLFTKNESTALTVSLYGGDDQASSAASADCVLTVAAGAVTAPRAKVARTSLHRTLEQVAGKGVTVKITATSPLRVEYRGFGISRTEGPQERPFS